MSKSALIKLYQDHANTQHDIISMLQSVAQIKDDLNSLITKKAVIKELEGLLEFHSIYELPDLIKGRISQLENGEPVMSDLPIPEVVEDALEKAKELDQKDTK